LGGRVHTIRKNADGLVVARKETGLEGNADKTRYMAMYRDQHAGRSQNIKTYNISLAMVEEFKYLGTDLAKYEYNYSPSSSVSLHVSVPRNLSVLSSTKII
jgi:hypothetical protein